MTRTFPAKKAALLVVLALGMIVANGQALAYDRWSVADNATNCRACHGDFRAGVYISPVDGQNWGNIHNLHRNTMVSGDCDVCHLAGDEFPVMMASSAGGTGMEAIGCVGCHGREEDNVPSNPEFPNGYGAGLRQHHFITGTTGCVECHMDADPANYTPVGENVLPPYYANPGSGHPNIPTDPCNQDGSENFAGAAIGQDNDGDDLYDGDDTDCTATPVFDVPETGALLIQNYPNPFNPQTVIRYRVADPGQVRLSVFTVGGEFIYNLVDGYHDGAGTYSVNWYGVDQQGRAVPSGVYIYRLEAGNVSESKRMMLVR